MRYAKIMYNDVVDTDAGICVSVWLQGCPFRCKGCHNPDTWDFNGGIETDESALIEDIMGALEKNGISRNLSILGGEPLCAENLNFTKKILQLTKKVFPNKKVYIWTGFEFHQLQQNSKYNFILDNADVLITGPFILEQRDITLPLRGSKNQQVWRKDKNNKLTLSKK